MKRACVTWKVKQINKMFENGNLVFDNVIQRIMYGMLYNRADSLTA